VARWVEVEAEAPELVRHARGLLDAHVHKTLATLRRDGSPRISGIECQFVDGDLWLGMMARSVKALDLLRDPRFALHSGSDDPPGWQGDAKVAGLVEEVTDPAARESVLGASHDRGGAHLFRCDVRELVVVHLGEPRDHLVIASWHEGRGFERRERR
jgi:hypothetical protein